MQTQINIYSVLSVCDFFLSLHKQLAVGFPNSVQDSFAAETTGSDEGKV